ncbi:MAG TPA: ATP-binding cassette domain-containing protein [Thermomicrobiaceae bacterium]|nr:ATP-binding cassette domain-containing protein [Thermomicrobiaceae bacterium]
MTSVHQRDVPANAIEAGEAPSEAVVETHNLTRRYGSHTIAVDKLNLTIRRGEVYGFLGPNGAGKTTTMKMLVGLIRPTSGTITVLGKAPGAPAMLAETGSLIEAPAFYPYLSGRRNLEILATYTGTPKSRVSDVLRQVELTSRADDAFKGYSLGMKQRLGVAGALLKDPELLILDEPSNGLDPKGMAEMRDLIRGLRAEQRTVLVSTHLLSEIEQVCDRVGVIQHGRIVAEGTVAELRGQSRIFIRATPVDRACGLITGFEGVSSIEVAGDGLTIAAEPALAGTINRFLVGQDIDVSELRPIEQSLEEIYLGLTDGTDEPDLKGSVVQHG